MQSMGKSLLWKEFSGRYLEGKSQQNTNVKNELKCPEKWCAVMQSQNDDGNELMEMNETRMNGGREEMKSSDSFHPLRNQLRLLAAGCWFENSKKTLSDI